MYMYMYQHIQRVGACRVSFGSPTVRVNILALFVFTCVVLQLKVKMYGENTNTIATPIGIYRGDEHSHELILILNRK